MKKLTLIISALALVLGMSQCTKKPNMPTFDGGFTGVNKTITFTANGGDGSKATIDNSTLGELGYKWEEGDVLYVYGSEDGTFSDGKFCGKLDLVSEPGQVSGTFKGVAEVPEGENAKLHFYYFGGGVTETKTGEKITSVTAEFDLENQVGSIDATGLKGKIIAMKECKAGETTEYGGELAIPFAIVQFDLKDFAGADPVVMTGTKYDGLNVTAQGVISKTEGTSTTLASTNLGEDNYYVAIIADDVTKLEFGGNYHRGSKVVETGVNPDEFVNGVFYTASDKKSVKIKGDNKLVSGLFSVSATKQVRFAVGNMYWDGDSFEIDSDPTSYTSTRTETHIDYSFWQPYSRMDKSYTLTYDGTGASVNEYFFTNGQTAETMGQANPDFVVNGEKGKYRVLTEAEKVYLINRNNSTKHGFGTVKGVNVLIIVPDAFSCPDGCSFTCYEPSHFVGNSYNETQMDAMTNAGAIFLPTAGFYTHDQGSPQFSSCGSGGLYWLADPSLTGHSSFAGGQPYGLAKGFVYGIVSGYVGVEARQHGYRVRLACDAD